MESLGVAKSRSNPWGSGDKGSLLDSGKGRGGSGGGSGGGAFGSLDSPLATQLQQAWLQTQLPKRNVPKLDFLSPLPSPDYYGRSSPDYYPSQAHAPAKSLSSSLSQPSPQSFSPANSCSFSESTLTTSHSDVGSVSPLTDNDFGGDSDPMDADDEMLQYLADMLMDEDLSEKKCMYVQCSAYQAMTRELADLISDTGPPGDFHSGSTYEGGGCEDEKDVAVNSWIDEVLSANPQDYSGEEQQQVLQQQQLPQHQQQHRGFSSKSSKSLNDDVTSIAYGITNITTDPPRTLTPVIPPTVPEQPAAALKKAAAALDLDCVYLENDSSTTDYSNGRSGIESLEELYPLLMQCAQAVAADDVRQAHLLISELRQRSSPFGDGGQRMTYYFVEALVARLSGTGAQLYTALSSNRPSAHEMLKAFRLYVRCNPLPKLAHMYANLTIYKTALGSDRIHIIDFGILYGVQWPCLLAKLAQRPGGPPSVRITGIDFAQPGFQKNDRVEETGRRLALKAKELGVEFEYHPIAGKWESIQPAQLTLRNDETLIVNSMYRLRNLLDETVMASSPRKAVLAKIHSLNPKIFVMGVLSSGYNSPFFMARFRETINHFSALFDAVHSSVPPDTELRSLAEKEILGREILNIIACEGTERIERAETYRQWQSRSINAGFKQQQLDPEILTKAHIILKEYHKNYGAAQDGNWLLTGWKDRVLFGHTAWTCS